MKARIVRSPIKFGVDKISLVVEHEGVKYAGCLTEVEE